MDLLIESTIIGLIIGLSIAIFLHFRDREIVTNDEE